MRYYLQITVAVVIAAMIASSCSMPKVELRTECDVATDVLLRQIQIELLELGFDIKGADFEAGYLRASIYRSTPGVAYSNWQVTWSFREVQGEIVAYYEQNSAGILKYGDDSADRSIDLYWNVRNRLEELCRHKIRFVEIEK